VSIAHVCNGTSVDLIPNDKIIKIKPRTDSNKFEFGILSEMIANDVDPKLPKITVIPYANNKVARIPKIKYFTVASREKGSFLNCATNAYVGNMLPSTAKNKISKSLEMIAINANESDKRSNGSASLDIRSFSIDDKEKNAPIIKAIQTIKENLSIIIFPLNKNNALE